ncbi:unnamed protein product [Paramecium primaurelia]|uniref:Urocanase Rossmann-like domain-containing protein n=1 Tax=Paramecium primaurelia TaxID=5886 RepID=A0A8S1LA19_PARPR|nr:unnamed protein product [Paramecium primaurelia]
MKNIGNTINRQTTSGSYCYIGNQGIVHETTLKLLYAARKYLKTDSLNFVVFVSSELGGMSGAGIGRNIFNRFMM